MIGRLDRDDPDRLQSPRCVLDKNRDPRPVGNRTLPEIPQHIGVQQDIGASLVADDETKTTRGIEPFDRSADLGNNRFIGYGHNTASHLHHAAARRLQTHVSEQNSHITLAASPHQNT